MYVAIIHFNQNFYPTKDFISVRSLHNTDIPYVRQAPPLIPAIKPTTHGVPKLIHACDVARTEDQTAMAALDMVGRAAALHIMRVLMTSSGVVAAAANAPETAPMQKSSCSHQTGGMLRGAPCRIASQATHQCQRKWASGYCQAHLLKTEGTPTLTGSKAKVMPSPPVETDSQNQSLNNLV